MKLINTIYRRTERELIRGFALADHHCDNDPASLMPMIEANEHRLTQMKRLFVLQNDFILHEGSSKEDTNEKTVGNDPGAISGPAVREVLRHQLFNILCMIDTMEGGAPEYTDAQKLKALESLNALAADMNRRLGHLEMNVESL